MSYASDMALGGALSGIDEGIEYGHRRQLTTARERREQEAHELRKRTTESNERRAQGQDQRAIESHDINMRTGKLQLSEAELKQEHEQFVRELDAELGRFVATNGVDYQGIERIYNDRYPDGGKVKIERSADGKFTLDFGENGKQEGLTAEEVAGMASYMKDPDLYLETLREAAERKRTQADDLAKEERAHGRALELKRTPAADATSWRTLTRQDVDALGLPPENTYRESNTGKVETIVKPPRGGITMSLDENGKTVVEVGGPMGTAAKNKVEEKLINAGDTMASLTAIKARFKPEYQTVGNRMGASWSRLKDKVSPESLTAEDRKSLTEFTQYRSEAAQLFSITLKDLSGAAVTPHEMKRAEAWLPNPGTGMFDGDSPAELEAKIARFEDFTRKALAKYAYIRRNGLGAEDIDLEDIPRLMQERGEVLRGEYMKQGLSDDQARQATKQRLSDEFGIGMN